MLCVEMMQERALAVLPFAVQPEDILRAWPSHDPLVVLYSGPPSGEFSRYSIFAAPSAWLVCHQGRSHWVSETIACPIHRFASDPLKDFGAVFETFSGCAPAHADGPVWIGYFSYELGQRFEPSAAGCTMNAPNGDAAYRQSADDAGWPEMALAYCPWYFRHDSMAGCWTACGQVPPQMLDHLCGNSRHEVRCNPEDFSVSNVRFATSDAHFASLVARTLEYIGNGDIYQANLSRALTADFRGSSRALAANAFTRNHPRYGSYLELPEAAGTGRCILSMSPELFLQTRNGEILTRPMKGTRPSGTDPNELDRSEKDCAELNMIIDLMRNDLSRICEAGSVRVRTPRLIEKHGTVHQAVGEVVGRLRMDIDVGDIIRAVFPPGSVTGAPKIRAMQIINELEGGVHTRSNRCGSNAPRERDAHCSTSRRGPYCGAIGVISAAQDMQLSVAIRTMTLEPANRARDASDGCVQEPRNLAAAIRAQPGTFAHDAQLVYRAGCGVVADSVPAQEVAESRVKCAALARALNIELPPAH